MEERKKGRSPPLLGVMNTEMKAKRRRVDDK
jgi:hypothetical protein